MTLFASRESVEHVELGDRLATRFDNEGLMPAIVVDADSGEILMLGHMNAEAMEQTIGTRKVHFWSRSRTALWCKGEHSGFTQSVERILVDDDQDALILHVSLAGPGSCHVGYRSCFYRELVLPAKSGGPAELKQIEADRAFDAKAVYAGLCNPTRL